MENFPRKCSSDRRTYQRPRRRLLNISLLCFIWMNNIVSLSYDQGFIGRHHEPSIKRLEVGSAAAEEKEILVAVEDGTIRGKRSVSRDGREFLTFMGLPYAKPPIGNLRFAPPEAPIPWSGILDAKEPRSQCCQLTATKPGHMGDLPVIGSEDCLYINIHTPKHLEELENQNPFPVILFIHGGVNDGNGTKWLPDYFMDEDIVLVFLQFRLHVFGNLNTGDEVSRGNYHLKDQVMALKWVQKNIRKFGGDPQRVTIYGSSSGSMLASAHLLSPMGKGLFHGVIMESGTLLTPSVARSIKASKKEAAKLAETIHCPRNTSKELVDCLRQADAEVIMAAARNWNVSISVEPISNHPAEDTCLPSKPLKLLRHGKIHDVPTIHGVANAECLAYALEVLLDMKEINVDEALRKTFGSNRQEFEYGPNPEAMLQTLRDKYFGKQNLTRDSIAHNFTNLLSDRTYVHPLLTFLKFQLGSGTRRKSPTFLYYTTKVPENGFATLLKELWGPTKTPFGGTHADELHYILPSAKFPYAGIQSPEYNFSKYMVKLWVNFATYGRPTTEDDKVEWKNAKWGTDSEAPLDWFELGDIPKMIQPEELIQRLKIWDSFHLTDLYI